MPKHYQDAAGVWHHTFHQSWVKQFFMCPEHARQDMLGLTPSEETEAAAMGTGMHAAAEHVLGGNAWTLAQLEQVAIDAFEAEMSLENARYVQVKQQKTAHNTIKRLVNAWVEHVLPTLPNDHLFVEEYLRATIHEDDDRIIQVGGTLDYVSAGLSIWDWKTANREYEQWEADRFHIQPTMYTFLVREHVRDLMDDLPDTMNFTYAVALKRKECYIQEVHVQRTAAHWEWLRLQLVGIAQMIEARLPSWPLNDQGWWCSEKWCPLWKDCKGKYIDS